MPSQANQNAELIQYFEARRAEAVELLRWLVEQESMSRVPEATTSLAEKLAAKLEERGAPVDFVRDAHAGAALRARFSARARAPEDKQLLIIGHLDTVWPLGTMAARPFRIDGNRAYGPGTFDMKSGLMIAAFAMQAIKALGR